MTLRQQEREELQNILSDHWQKKILMMGTLYKINVFITHAVLHAGKYIICRSTLKQPAVHYAPQVRGQDKLQALVYNILHPTTATVDYAIGLEKLSANRQFFCCCSKSSRFVTDNSKLYQVFLLQLPTLLTPAQIKPKSFPLRWK